MRINQSPNWRALAVLGALLSVIIVWPTVLSMPMFSKSPSSTTTSTTTEQQSLPPFIASLSNLTSNVTTVAPRNGDIVQNDSFYSVREQNANYSDYSDYGSLLHLNVSTSDSADDDGDQDIEVDEHLTHDRGDIDPLYAIMESLDDINVSKSRRVKKSNMVYNKRKRKKTNDNDKMSAEDDVSNTTYLSSASISDDNNYITNSLSHNNKSSSSVSVSDVNSSDQVTAASIISHHYSSKRTRNSINSDKSEPNNDVDDDDIDVMSTKLTTTTILPTTTYSPSRGWRNYFSTTPADDAADVTSEFWNVDETSDRDNSDMYVTSPTTIIITSSPSSASLIRPTTTLTHTDYPVLSRTDRSVHMKRDIPDRQRGSSSSSNNKGGSTTAAEGEVEGGSIKSRRLKIHNKNHNYRNNNHTNSNSSNLDRNERSTISHISGPGRKIQLYIKNRFIQLMPDGTVNGTQDDLSDYTILQRTTVDVGRIKIQGVATCLYLCMDQCGAVYGSKEFTDDCVFNESMEQHNYNTYSSTYNSNSRRIYYLALNRHGEPRKLQIPPSRSLGKLATYTKAITETVAQIRVEKLIAKKFGANRVKHGIRQLCDTGKPLVELTDNILKARSQCTATNSNSNNSNSSNSNKNGQLNVPAANDKSRLSNSNSNLTNSTSNSISTISSSSSSTSNSSNGHTSSNSNNNHVIKKKKKKRRCRPAENEDEHNCQRGGPQAMKKRPANHNKMAKCKDAAPESTTAVECMNQKRPKKGGKKGGPKHNGGAKQNGGEGRRGGKKLNQNGRQQQGGNNNKNSNKKNNGKQPKNGLGGGGRTNTTTVHPMVNNKMARTRTAPSTTSTTTTTTVAPPATTTEETSAANSQQTQTLVSSSQVINGLNQTSSETAQDADESVGEDTSAEVETGEAEAEDDDTANDDDDSSSHLPFIGENTQLVSGTDDFLYDDDLDFLNLGLWKIFLLIWITKWFL